MVKRTDESDRLWSAYARDLAVRLRKLREDRGLSQEDVAFRAGLSRFVYQQYERGESRPGSPLNPQLRTLVALAHALGTHVGDILSEDTPDIGAHG